MCTRRGLVGSVSEILDQLIDKDGIKDEDGSTTKAGLDFHLAVLDGRRVDRPQRHIEAAGLIKYQDVAMKPARFLDAGLAHLKLDMIIKWLGSHMHDNVAHTHEGPDTARVLSRILLVVWYFVIHYCIIVFEQSDVDILTRQVKL